MFLKIYEIRGRGTKVPEMLISISILCRILASETAGDSACILGDTIYSSFPCPQAVLSQCIFELSHSFLTCELSVCIELQVLIIREKLAELYESEQQWSKAAQMLSGIDLDSGMRSASKIFYFILFFVVPLNVLFKATIFLIFVPT